MTRREKMGNAEQQQFSLPTLDWTVRDEFADSAMRTFVANAARDPEQLALPDLSVIAASSYALADAMLMARSMSCALDVPDLSALAKASGADDILSRFETIRGDLRAAQQRALRAEARACEAETKLRALQDTIVARPVDRRTH
jgi:hypothetical protein